MQEKEEYFHVKNMSQENVTKPSNHDNINYKDFN